MPYVPSHLPSVVSYAIVMIPGTVLGTDATYAVLGDDEAYEPGCWQAGRLAPSNDLHVTDGLRGMFSLAPTMFALMSRPQRGELPCDAL